MGLGGRDECVDVGVKEPRMKGGIWTKNYFVAIVYGLFTCTHARKSTAESTALLCTETMVNHSLARFYIVLCVCMNLKQFSAVQHGSA